MGKTPRDFLKVPEAAEAFGVSEKTIRNWIDAGQLPAIQPAGPNHATGSTGASCSARSGARGSDQDDDQAPWSSEDRPGELATSDRQWAPSTKRRSPGTGMVTPREPLVLKENGRTEELIPGRHRFIRSYPLVRQHPEWFRPCDSEDAETIERHKQLAERKLRRLGGRPEPIRAPSGDSRWDPTAVPSGGCHEFSVPGGGPAPADFPSLTRWVPVANN